MNKIIMMMKNDGKRAVTVSIPESSSPYRCMNIKAIMMNLGIATTVNTVSYTHLTLPTIFAV